MFRKVVNISSVVGLSGNAGRVNYATAKAAVIGMTKTRSREWGRYRVNVNCVAFGFIQTRMAQPLSADSQPVSSDGREIKYGNPPAVIASLEPESRYISGQVITIGGGVTF